MEPIPEGFAPEEIIALPEVAPADLLAHWRLIHGLPQTGQYAVDVRGKYASDPQAVHARYAIIWLLTRRKLLDDFIHGSEIDDVVLDVVAKYPLEPAWPGKKNPFPMNEILEEIKKRSCAS